MSSIGYKSERMEGSNPHRTSSKTLYRHILCSKKCLLLLLASALWRDPLVRTRPCPLSASVTYVLSPTFLCLFICVATQISNPGRPKPPNAFILFRSYYLSNPALLPHDTVQQKDISKYVAWVWNALPDEHKQQWYEKAREEKERREGNSPSPSVPASFAHMSSAKYSVSIPLKSSA